MIVTTNRRVLLSWREARKSLSAFQSTSLAVTSPPPLSTSSRMPSTSGSSVALRIARSAASAPAASAFHGASSSPNAMTPRSFTTRTFGASFGSTAPGRCRLRSSTSLFA